MDQTIECSKIKASGSKCTYKAKSKVNIDGQDVYLCGIHNRSKKSKVVETILNYVKVVHTKKVYSGKVTCQGKLSSKDNPRCTRKAYYLIRIGKDKVYMCGTHSTKKVLLRTNNKRKKLRIDPQDIIDLQEYIDDHKKTVKKTSESKLVMRKIKMMRQPNLESGFKAIFPNRRPTHRKYGHHMPQLSPMVMGPIDHGWDGIPSSINLENFWQGSKVYPSEADENGDPLPIWSKRRNEMFEDKEPRRHKWDKFPEMNEKKSKLQNKNIPLYSIFLDEDGNPKRYPYLKARKIYCLWYETFALKSNQFKLMKKWMDDGYNLMIFGYDAWDYPTSFFKKTGFDTRDGISLPDQISIDKHYSDPTKPFGHEIVLYCCLMGLRPWTNKETTKVDGKI